MNYTDVSIHFEFIEDLDELEVINTAADVTDTHINNGDVNVNIANKMADEIEAETCQIFKIGKTEFREYFMNYIAGHIEVFKKQGNSKGFTIGDAGKLFYYLTISGEFNAFEYKGIFEKEGVWAGKIKVLQKDILAEYPPCAELLSGIKNDCFRKYNDAEIDKIFNNAGFAAEFLAKFCKENGLNAATLARRTQFLMMYDLAFLRTLRGVKHTQKNYDAIYFFYVNNFRTLFKRFLKNVKGTWSTYWKSEAAEHYWLFENLKVK